MSSASSQVSCPLIACINTSCTFIVALHDGRGIGHADLLVHHARPPAVRWSGQFTCYEPRTNHVLPTPAERHSCASISSHVSSVSEMRMRSSQTIAGRLRVPGCMVLVLLTALSLIVAGTQPRHAHAAKSAGLYNAECPLAALAAVPRLIAPIQTADAQRVLSSSRASSRLPRSERDPVSPTRLTDPRAPPAPSC